MTAAVRTAVHYGVGLATVGLTMVGIGIHRLSGTGDRKPHGERDRGEDRG
jgi:hypothetical protein